MKNNSIKIDIKLHNEVFERLAIEAKRLGVSIPDLISGLGKNFASECATPKKFYPMVCDTVHQAPQIHIHLSQNSRLTKRTIITEEYERA